MLSSFSTFAVRHIPTLSSRALLSNVMCPPELCKGNADRGTSPFLNTFMAGNFFWLGGPTFDGWPFRSFLLNGAVSRAKLGNNVEIRCVRLRRI